METIIHNESGWRVRPNDVSALAEAIEVALALTPDQRQVLGAYARHWVSQYYTTAGMQAATLDVYRELLGG